MVTVLIVTFAIGVALGLGFGIPAMLRNRGDGDGEQDAIRPARPGEFPSAVATSGRRPGDESAPALPANPRAEAAGYDADTCRAFVSRLGDSVIDRAGTMFEHIDRNGQIDSATLASALGVAESTLPTRLTGWINRRAQQLRLDAPYEVERAQGHTIWRDRDGIAAALLAALRQESAARGLRVELPAATGSVGPTAEDL